MERWLSFSQPLYDSRGHFGQVTGSGWHPGSTGRSNSHLMILAATFVISRRLMTEFPTFWSVRTIGVKFWFHCRAAPACSWFYRCSWTAAPVLCPGSALPFSSGRPPSIACDRTHAEYDHKNYAILLTHCRHRFDARDFRSDLIGGHGK